MQRMCPKFVFIQLKHRGMPLITIPRPNAAVDFSRSFLALMKTERKQIIQLINPEVISHSAVDGLNLLEI